MSIPQEDLWKEDAQNLKNDLDNREKIVQKNEVDIKFGGTKKSSQSNEENKDPKNSAGSAETDALLRKRLGLD